MIRYLLTNFELIVQLTDVVTTKSYIFMIAKQPKQSLTYKINKQQSGFTLIEILTVVVVIGILASIAIPSFISVLKKWEAKQVRSEIFNGYKMARTESFIHHTNIVMCPADINGVCNKDAQAFFLIFSDRDDNHQYDAEINTLILKQPLKLHYGHIHLRAGRRNYIKFFGDTGLPRGHFGHIKYCPTDHNTTNMFQISLNKMGKSRFKPFSLKPTDCP